MRRVLIIAGSAAGLGTSWALALAVGTFSLHMTAHVLAVAVTAPALVLGGLMPRRLAAPSAVLLACAVELLVVWGWHLPALHRAAADSAVLFVTEQLMFLAAGTAVWAGIGPGRSRHDAGGLVGTAALLVTSMHMTLLGALLMLAQNPLYQHGPADHGLADQQLGGLIMLIVCGPAYLCGALLSLGRMLRAGQAAPGVDA